jgi:phage-related protein
MPLPFTDNPPFNPIPPPLPLGPLGIIIGIVEFIMKLFGFGSPDLKPVIKAVNNTWANLAVGAAFLYNALGSIYDFIKKLFSILYDALKHILKDIIHGHLLQALKDIQAMFKAIKALFQPILNFIARLRGLFYKYIYPWIKLVQDILSTVRAFLAVFRILGVKWAAKLDADIQRLQGYITGFLQGIIGTLNQASTWINFIADPFGLVRRSVFNNTLFTGLGGVRRAVSFGKDRYMTASEAQNTQQDISMAHGGAAIATRNADGSVTNSDASKRIDSAGTQAWNFYGPPKIGN